MQIKLSVSKYLDNTNWKIFKMTKYKAKELFEVYTYKNI